MQLNEILEENSTKAISKKTNISESNIELLLAKEFDRLKRVKTFGFISILEREYKVDLSALKQEAEEYYAQYHQKESVTLGLPMQEEKKGKSKLFLLIVLGLLGYASWYFFTQFDQKQLMGMLPFSEEKIVSMNVDGESNEAQNSTESLTVSESSNSVNN